MTDRHTALPLQAALASFIDRGYLARHVRRMRAVYQERHQRIVDVLGDRFTDLLKVIPSSAGLHVAATVPATAPEELDAALRRASAAGVEVLPLSPCDVGPPSQPGIALGYGAIPVDRVDEGLDRLRQSFE